MWSKSCDHVDCFVNVSLSIATPAYHVGFVSGVSLRVFDGVSLDWSLKVSMLISAPAYHFGFVYRVSLCVFEGVSLDRSLKVSLVISVSAYHFGFVVHCFIYTHICIYDINSIPNIYVYACLCGTTTHSTRGTNLRGIYIYICLHCLLH